MIIGFIGLGIMGLPMATNLVTAGHDVRAYNRSPREFSGTVADSAAAAVTGADVVITMLPDSPDVEAVVLGPDGVLAAAAPGTLLIDMSTIAPATARTIADAATEAGFRALDAPVSGGEQGAIDGALSIMVGGAADDFQAAKPVLDVLGSTVVHVGPAGSGQTVKAANQLIVAGTIGLVAEALTFLAAHSVDLEPAVAVLAGGLAGNRILDRKAAGMIAHHFEPGFRIDLHHKDLGIVVDSARAAGVTVPLGAVAAQLMGAARAQGHGSLDHSALLLVIEALSKR
ncbi:2-hydroxy-3-oxopropionate reductase [Kribbella flavida DSM 17836]|uniref:2-hydroxy-3-oxopropionate reductase n=1 Tax=Kribbella flavida (strain DSM 17836 / JCM 10339 / NBRC 14399) TaxID=479435 RepID=D2Q235_KRIFD|nr:2-hydroxy-3-oxopropionate reductase [Kribbella flavida]ADB33981.1 2-hydroxy-3-oxopropionate reductase [Kribbella flavida DSM 17836]